MPTYVTPGVYYEFVDLAPPAIGAVRLDITAFLGMAERGPVQKATPVNSWQQFQSQFGSLLPYAYLGYAVKGFFENGGDRCHIVRIAAPHHQTVTENGVAQPADRKSSIVISVAGFAPGAVVTVHQGPTRFDHLLKDVDAATRTLTWTDPLEAAFNVALPITFHTGAAPARGLLRDANGHPVLRVKAITEGIWGNEVEIHVSHASLASTVTAAVMQPSVHTSSIVASVTGFPVGSVVKIYQAKSPAPIKVYRQVVKVDPALKTITWDSALPGTFDFAKTISFESLEFGLTVFEQRRITETYGGLSLVKEHPRYAPDVIEANSDRIRLEPVVSPSAWPDRLPAIGSVRLASGRDGTAAITMQDYTGDPGSEKRWGIRLLELVEEIGLLAAPDLMAQSAPATEFNTPPPPRVNPCPCGVAHPPAPAAPPKLVESITGFSLDQIAWVQQMMAAHCESERYRFALLDPPVFPGARDSSIAEIQSWRNRFDTKFAALYFPWLLVSDPLRISQQTVRAIPPCGHMAGIIAQTDLSIGVYKAPANVELAWAQDVTTWVDAKLQGILNPANINCIRLLPGRGLRIYGARTLSSDTSWTFINVRRLLMLIEKSVEISTQWSVFEPNDYNLRQSLVLSISGFLEKLWKDGALSGGSAATSFFVKADEENNPPELADLGQLVVEVGVAPTYPAEFVIFRIGRTKDTLEITE